MATLIEPPTPSPEKAHIEHVLELTRLGDIDPNLFTNTRPLWHPPGARGIYGGAVIAQCLAAAQRTVPDNFTVHSMHCYFVLNGNAEIPVIYHVERVREGRSFCTRTVQARQRGKPIFTTTLSFMREGSGGAETVEHAAKMGEDVAPPPPDCEHGLDAREWRGDKSSKSPFVSRRLCNLNNRSTEPDKIKARQWIKARGRISDKGGFQAHLSAVAYMSDSYFIGTVARVHRLWRYGNQADKNKPRDPKLLDSLPDVLKNSAITPEVLEKLQSQDPDTLKRMEGMMDGDVIEQLRSMRVIDGKITQGEVRPEIGMMVSLDHTIYFHNPKDFRADEWMYSEMETPWAGDGRGFVTQRIYSKSGKLIASCVQEGVVRLKQKQQGPKL